MRGDKIAAEVQMDWENGEALVTFLVDGHHYREQFPLRASGSNKCAMHIPGNFPYTLQILVTLTERSR